ncbi:MAG: hypothetical protein JRE63_12805, partial [Deltaproteobacteria bacterium]|nr:hypothetical protein [Deltaproteobacteria bacterium]
IALAFSFSHMTARPHLFSWLCLLITLNILLVGGNYLCWLPLISVVWANLHGSFILCLVLQFIFICGTFLESQPINKINVLSALKRLRKPIAIFVISIIVCGLNPFGYELLVFPFAVSKGIFSEIIAEWQPPNTQGMWYFRYYILALLVFYSLSNNAVTWTERLLALFFVNAALLHIRHISLLVLVLSPFIAKMIHFNIIKTVPQISNVTDNSQLRLSSASGPLITLLIALGLIFTTAINSNLIQFLTPDKIIEVKVDDLDELIAFFDKHRPEGRMFNEYALGGYMIFALEDPPKVFIDGRADMYGEQILLDYQQIRTSEKFRNQLLEYYKIDWIVSEKGSELISSLNTTGLWRTKFENNSYVVLVRTNHLFDKLQPEHSGPTMKL